MKAYRLTIQLDNGKDFYLEYLYEDYCYNIYSQIKEKMGTNEVLHVIPHQLSIDMSRVIAAYGEQITKEKKGWFQ